MFETVIFDLDGTLLDTLDDLANAVNAALVAHGLKTRTREEVCAFVGNGIKNLIERAIGQKEYPDFESVFGYFKSYYKEHCAEKTKPYEDILKLLKILKARGVKKGVVSNKADFATKLLVKEYFCDLLDLAMGENEAAGINKKPAPDWVLAMINDFGASKETTVYIGDSDVDIQTAKNAGVVCISCTWGFRDKAFLVENGASILVDTPMEILNYCK